MGPRVLRSPIAHESGGGSFPETDATSAETPVARGTQEPAPVTTDPRIEDWGVVGRGGMGQVHRVFDRSIRRFAALKVLDPELVKHEKARRRFLAEAQITGQLEHPNVVPVYDLELSEDGSPKHFTMRLIDGLTFTQVIARHNVLERTEAQLWEHLQIFLRVCDAVAYAHSRGVVHCDLKPDNVMIGPHGRVYVMDWGIARTFGEPLPLVPLDELEAAIHPGGPPPVSVQVDTRDEGSIVGTYQYMAPEQARGRADEIDARTDVFALGGLLFYILTGAAPYDSREGVETVDPARGGVVPHPTEVSKASLSPALCTIAMRALAAERSERYASVDALKRDVERALRGGLSLDTCRFVAGTVIIREGDPPDAAYILTRGRCEAYRTVGGERRSLREMLPGDVFGEMALLSKQARSASVVALDDVTAMVVTPEALAREVHSESWLVPLLRTLVERFRGLEERHR